jgi:hypothetical protein
LHPTWKSDPKEFSLFLLHKLELYWDFTSKMKRSSDDKDKSYSSRIPRKKAREWEKIMDSFCRGHS